MTRAVFDTNGMEYKRTEVGVIPEDWRVSSVGAEFTIQLGKMLDAAKNVGIAKPYLGNRSVQWGRVVLDDIATVPMTPSDLQRFRLKRGDLLVCEGGEIGRAAIWNDPIPECYYQKALHRLRPTGGYNVYLMMFLLQLWTSSDYLANYVTQTSIAHLPKDKLEQIPLPIPTPDEQRAIAEALSDVDALLESLESLIAKKRTIKQATMQQLLTGKTRLPGFSAEWQTMRLGELCPLTERMSFVKGRGLSKSDLSRDGTIPCIHYGELFSYGEHITDVLHGTDLEGDFVYSVHNDVLMPTSDVTPNGLATASCLQRTGVILGGGILAIRVSEDILDGVFLAYSIRHHRDQILQLVTGTTVYHLYDRDMVKFKFSVPTLEEQRAIAEVLSDMDAEIAMLEQRLDKIRAIKQGAMQQLLTGRIRLARPL